MNLHCHSPLEWREACSKGRKLAPAVEEKNQRERGETLGAETLMLRVARERDRDRERALSGPRDGQGRARPGAHSGPRDAQPPPNMYATPPLDS